MYSLRVMFSTWRVLTISLVGITNVRCGNRAHTAFDMPTKVLFDINRRGAAGTPDSRAEVSFRFKRRRAANNFFRKGQFVLALRELALRRTARSLRGYVQAFASTNPRLPSGRTANAL